MKSRGERIFLATLLGLGCVPWFFFGHAPSSWSLAAVGIALVGLVAHWKGHHFVARAMVPGVAAVCAFGGAATFAPVTPFLIVYLGLLLMAARAEGRGKSGAILLCAVCIAVSLVAAIVVLTTARWTDEADRLRWLLGGLACGSAVLLLGRRVATANPRRVCVLVAVCGMGAGIRQLVWVQPAATRLPAWREVARDLGPPVGARPRAALAQLERLRMVGARDAAMAWVGVVLADNAAAEEIAPFCFDGAWDGTLPGGWEKWVALGESACAAVHTWPPEDGAVSLQASKDPILQRVRGDLLMAAGDVAGGIDAYAAATLAGDDAARHDATMALMLRNLRDEAVRKAPPDDAFLMSQLHRDRVDQTMWRAWNHALDFTTLASPARAGIVTRGSPGSLLSMYEPLHARRVIATLPKDPTRFSVELPLPPGAIVPWELSLRVQVRRHLRVELVNDAGETLIYSCDAEADDPLSKSLGPGVCSGDWTDVTLEPADALSGSLTRLALVGEFALAYVSARPAGGP